jgi:hypothetical protein
MYISSKPQCNISGRYEQRPQAKPLVLLETAESDDAPEIACCFVLFYF